MTIQFSKWTITALAMAVAAPVFAQDSAKVQSQSYRVVLDNDKVRVLGFTGKPGMGVCGAGLHSHPGHVTVLLTPAKVKVTVNGKSTMVTGKAGDAFWEPPVTHETENYGRADVRSLIIEVKTPASVK